MPLFLARKKTTRSIGEQGQAKKSCGNATMMRRMMHQATATATTYLLVGSCLLLVASSQLTRTMICNQEGRKRWQHRSMGNHNSLAMVIKVRFNAQVVLLVLISRFISNWRRVAFWLVVRCLCGCCCGMVFYSKRIIIVRWADLGDFFRSVSSVKCVFLFHVQ